MADAGYIVLFLLLVFSGVIWLLKSSTQTLTLYFKLRTTSALIQKELTLLKMQTNKQGDAVGIHFRPSSTVFLDDK